MPENSRKGMSMIMIMIFIVVALLVFAMIGGGFKGTFTGIMDSLEKAVGGAFGGDFIGDGEESFKIEIKSPNRDLLEIGVYDSEGEKVYGKPKPSKVIQTGLKEGNKYTLFFIFRNKLGQKVKAESAEFKVGEEEKVEFTAEVKEDKGYGGGSYFLDEAELKPKDILIELPPYISSSEHVEITRDKWTYGEENTIEPSEWNSMVNGVVFLKNIDLKVCGWEMPAHENMLRESSLVVESRAGGRKIHFSEPEKNTFYTTDCDRGKTCVLEANIYPREGKRDKFCNLEDNSGPTKEEVGAEGFNYAGWKGIRREKSIGFSPSEGKLKISMKVYLSTEKVEGNCNGKKVKACSLGGEYPPQGGGKKRWGPGPMKLESTYRKVCPAGYTMVEGDCEKIEK